MKTKQRHSQLSIGELANSTGASTLTKSGSGSLTLSGTNTYTGKTIIKVVDTATDTVIRQIPSEEAIAIAKSIDKMQGLLIKALGDKQEVAFSGGATIMKIIGG